jgi:hypothetical protein
MVVGHISTVCGQPSGLHVTLVGVDPAHGHLEVLRTVVDTLQSSGQNIIEAEPELKGRAMVNWTRYVRQVINARNLQGQTPLMLACQNGCATRMVPGFGRAV